MTDTFRAERVGHVLTLSFGCPGTLTVLSQPWLTELEQHLAEAQREPQVRVVLLFAQGEDFCAGGDLRSFRAGPSAGLGSAFGALLVRLQEFEKPIVAAVHGRAIGGGATLLLHFDLVYAAETAVFCLPFTSLGLVPEFGSSVLLPLHAGTRLANELVLLGQPFDAEKALRAGFVNDVAPAAEVIERARATAATLAAQPPAAVRASKRLLRIGHRASLSEAVAAEDQALRSAFRSPEMQEAIAAFMERRPPDFSRFS